MKYTAILVTFLIMIAGCVPLREVKPPVQINDTDSTARVLILRNYNFWGGGVHLWPTLDGEDVAGLRTNEYTEILVTESVHNLGVRYYGNWKFIGWNHNEIKVDLKRGEQYYYLLSPTIIGTFEIEEIEQEKALRRIAKSKLVKPGTISE